jgi:hypothetical protein
MRAPRFYLGSTIWNFALAEGVPEYRDATDELFEHVRAFGWETFTSEVVLAELREAEEPKRSRLLGLIGHWNPVEVPVDEEVLTISEAYMTAGVLSDRHREDCLHVACATIAECDYLLSWNFRHLANARRASRFVAVNMLHGYTKVIRICTPLEVYEV